MSSEVAVDGGALRVLRFGAGRATVLAAHGITASGMAFGAVARHLPRGWTMLAPDLRGRGHSARLPGPYGLARHVGDVCAVAERHAAGRQGGPGGPVVLAGHSMGAFVALLAAAARPDLFARLVLIDGGLPLPLHDGASGPDTDLDQRLDATLGPAIARLSQTFSDQRAYLDFFRAHPALGPHWNADVEAYVAYDLTGPPGAMRSRVQPDAVRQDGRELLAGAARFAAALHELAMPALVLTAPGGMFGDPPGFMPPPLVRQWRAELPDLHAELVADSNHYTILLSPAAAALVARRLTDPASWP